MRTLFEIVDGAKDGHKPTHDECYYAMLALSGLLNMASSDVRKLANETTKPWARKWYAEENHTRYQQALNTDPQRYLGTHVPGSPEHDQFREMGKRIIEKVLRDTADGR